MAIYPNLGASSFNNQEIEAWTEQVTRSSAELPSPIASPEISLDENPISKQANNLDKNAITDGTSAAHRIYREPFRRDSLQGREAILKGKEGSRRRQRWENGLCQREA